MAAVIYSNVQAAAGNSLTSLTAAANWYIEAIEFSLVSLTTSADGTWNGVLLGDLAAFFQMYFAQTGAATVRERAPRIITPKLVLPRGATIKLQTVCVNVTNWIAEINLYGSSLQ